MWCRHSTQGFLSLLSSLLVLSLLPSLVASFIIAPPWAEESLNPCARRSWQLLLWPADGRCYQIFGRGPCPPTQELAFDHAEGGAVCRCPKDLLYWPETDRCYPEYSKGPCEPNQYLERVVADDGRDSSGDDVDNGTGVAASAASLSSSSSSSVGAASRCADMERCENGWIFWPRHQRCYQLYTQGPCHKGDLLIVNPLSAEPYCGCDAVLLRQYYFNPLGLCYEHFTRGPCESGLLFAYNHTSGATGCLCSPALDNFHPQTGRCFQFGAKGPCRKGQEFGLDESSGQGICTCKKGYILWPENGQCYKAFTPGPCGDEEFIVPFSSTVEYADNRGGGGGGGGGPGDFGVCVKNPCPKAHLYFPDPGSGRDSVRCHKVGSRGPCALGELVVFEKYSGKSYRGECGCSPGYNQNFWSEDGSCYEWYTRGPCKEGFLFQYDRKKGSTECVCDEREGFVYWNETDQCYRVYTQGPCPRHAWLIPGDDNQDVAPSPSSTSSGPSSPSDMGGGVGVGVGVGSGNTALTVDDNVFCECRAGFFFDAQSYTCRSALAAAAGAINGAGAGGVPVARPIKMSLLPYARAPGGGGGGLWRDSHESFVFLERLRLHRQQKFGGIGGIGGVDSGVDSDGDGGDDQKVDPGSVDWSAGVFVTPGGEDEARRRADEDSTVTLVGSGQPSSSSSGWGAKALPRIGRTRRFRRGKKGRRSRNRRRTN